MPLPTYQEWWNSSWKKIGIRDDLLRKIDRTLQAFHTAAAGTVQKKIFLADIYVHTLHWMRRNRESSRLPALVLLHSAASKDVTESLSPICSAYLRRLADDLALPPLRVRVRLLRTANVNRDPLPDVQRASEIWRQASITITAWPPGAQAEQVNLALLPDQMTLGYTGEGQLVHHVNPDQGFIHCCYAARISGDGAAGKTERPEDHAGHLFDPLIKIGATLARPETFAHEVGHALLNDGAHHPDPMNLMAEGASRKGSELTPGQIVMARGSKYAIY